MKNAKQAPADIVTIFEAAEDKWSVIASYLPDVNSVQVKTIQGTAVAFSISSNEPKVWIEKGGEKIRRHGIAATPEAIHAVIALEMDYAHKLSKLIDDNIF